MAAKAKPAPKTSFQWNGATIGVRDLTIADGVRITRLMTRANGGAPADSDDPRFMTMYTFAEFQIAAAIEGASPVPHVNAETSTDEEIEAALTAWESLPLKFGTRWREAYNASQDSDDDPNG